VTHARLVASSRPVLSLKRWNIHSKNEHPAQHPGAMCGKVCWPPSGHAGWVVAIAGVIYFFTGFLCADLEPARTLPRAVELPGLAAAIASDSDGSTEKASNA
jgi:hypothetical protein